MSQMCFHKICVFGVLALLSLKFGTSSSQCIKLENCGPLSWLNDMKGQQGFEETKESFSKKCNRGLVNCPTVLPVNPDSNGETNVTISSCDPTDPTDEHCTDNTATATSKGKVKCEGSIVVYSEDKDGNIGEQTYDGAEYKTFGRRLIRKSAIKFQVKGDCCWGLYKFKNFFGEKTSVILKSGIHPATIQPKSIKKMNCF